MNKPPLKIGITGGIGSGKSHVAGVLRRWGIPVYDTDREAKRLMQESADIRRGLTALLGPGAYGADGKPDKARVAAYLFGSPEHARRINGLVHPAVQDDFLRWAAGQDAPLVAMECAILYESGFDRLVDEVLLVVAPEDVCLERAMKRDGATESQVKARMAAQMPDAERRARARYVVDNGSGADVEPALKELLARMAREHQPRD